MTRTWRLIDDRAAPRSAAGHMHADLSLLQEVAEGREPALRFYQWDPPALSLGRFQPDDDVDVHECVRRGIEIVRRPTGGRALLHGGDLTYSVVMPRPAGEAGAVDALYCRLAGALIAGLAVLGVSATVARNEGPAAAACFSTSRGSDLRVDGRKLVGSAQVHRHGAVLQHGSVLLRRLEIDETDLLVFSNPASRSAERARLKAGTVTLADLGVNSGPGAVVAALTRGFAESLDLDFMSTSNAGAFIAAEKGRQ